MANVKITDLNAIVGGDVADDDQFVVVDLDADETKKVSRASLRVALSDSNDYLTFSVLQSNLNIVSSNVDSLATVSSDTGTWEAGNLVPKTNVVYDLGNSSQRWRDLYLSNGSIKLGEVTLSAAGTEGLTITGATGTQANLFTPEGGSASNLYANVVALESNSESLAFSISLNSANINLVQDNVASITSRSDLFGTYANNTFTTNVHIDAKIADLVDSAPEALNTLNELAQALGDDQNFSNTVLSSLSNLQANVDLVQSNVSSIVLSTVSHTTSTSNSYSTGEETLNANTLSVYLNGVYQNQDTFILANTSHNVQFKESSLVSGLLLEIRKI